MDLPLIAHAIKVILTNPGSWGVIGIVLALSLANSRAYERVIGVMGYLFFSIIVSTLVLVETGVLAKLRTPHSATVDLLVAAIVFAAFVLPYIALFIVRRIFAEWRRERRIRAAINNSAP